MLKCPLNCYRQVLHLTQILTGYDLFCIKGILNTLPPGHLSVEVHHFKAWDITHFFLQFFREENIPAEILARGPEAVEAYHKLRRLGTAPLYRGRVFLVGLDRFEKCFYSCQRLVRKMLLFLSKTGSKNSVILVKDWFEKHSSSKKLQKISQIWFYTC